MKEGSTTQGEPIRATISSAKADGASAATMPAVEFEQRLLYSLIVPVVRLAARFRIKLDTVLELVTIAYFDELRRRGMTLKEAADVLGKSLRTITALSRQKRANFYAAENEAGLARAIEFHLAVSPLTQAGIIEAVALGAPGPRVATADRKKIERAIDLLVKEKRILPPEPGGGREYRVAMRYANMVRKDLTRRVDGLNNILEVLLDTVVSRFILEDDRVAMARVFTFGAPLEGVVELRDKLFELLKVESRRLEDEAEDKGLLGQKFSISMCVTATLAEDDEE